MARRVTARLVQAVQASGGWIRFIDDTKKNSAGTGSLGERMDLIRSVRWRGSRRWAAGV